MEGASWSAGLQVSNLGPKIKISQIQRVSADDGQSRRFGRLAVFTDAPSDDDADLGYRLAPSDVQAVNVSVGAEYTLAEHFMFRGGYHYGDKEKRRP